jgi:bacterioferritin
MPGQEERRRAERRRKNMGPPKNTERRKSDRRSNPGSFVRDITELRRRARRHIEAGAVTEGYGLDPRSVVAVLNEALATEIVCVLRYKRHYFMATGIHAQTVAAEFLQHATDEQAHADQIADRITQLGGAPNFDPEGLAMRSHSQYVEGGSLVDMIREDLVAERIAIESYSEIARFLGDKDITTRRMMEGILAMEEEHADDLMNLLTTLDPSKKG